VGREWVTDLVRGNQFWKDSSLEDRDLPVSYSQWICSPSIFTNSSGNWPLLCIFSSSETTYQWTLPRPTHGHLCLLNHTLTHHTHKPLVY
jgi:hypothetical protein